MTDNKDLIERLRCYVPSHTDFPHVQIRMMSEAADALEAQQWQDIETAPKDGRFMLLLADVPWLVRVGSFYNGKFVSHPSGSMENDQPTKWMPLPPIEE